MPVLLDQQRIADAFYDLILIPKKVSVRDAVLPPIPKVARTAWIVSFQVRT